MPAIIGTGTQRAAKTSRVQVASQYLAFASFDAKVSGADLSTVNFESYNAVTGETYAEGIMGVLSCDFNFGGAWDAATKPTGTPPGLYPRDDLANVSLITARQDGTAWTFPYSRIRGTNQGSNVEGLVLFEVSDAKNQGRFTFP